MHRPQLVADRSRRGSVAVEYVCLITIIIAILIPSIASVGWLMQQEFSALDRGTVATTAESATPAEPTSSPIASPTPKSLEIQSLVVTEFSLVFAVLAIIAVGVLALRRHRFHKLAEEAAAKPTRPKMPAHLSLDLFDKRQKIQLAISTHWCKGVDGRLLVSELMTRGPKCVSPSTTCEEAKALMQKRDLHHLLVTDEGGVLVGVLSSHDFDRREGDDVHSAMTPDPHRVLAHNTISEAITILLTHRVHCLPVENGDGQLVGILTGSDIAMGLQCALRAIEEVSLVLAGRESGHMPIVSAEAIRARERSLPSHQ